MAEETVATGEKKKRTKASKKTAATAFKAPEKKDAGKKTAASGDKKKRTKARKETYSSYIYKGESLRRLEAWALCSPLAPVRLFVSPD